MCSHGESALHFNDAVESERHVFIVNSADAEIMRVMPDAGGDGATFQSRPPDESQSMMISPPVPFHNGRLCKILIRIGRFLPGPGARQIHLQMFRDQGSGKESDDMGACSL